MIGSRGTGLLIKVGMAQFKVSMAPASMMTFALGSCVGIVFYDPVSKIGGLAHVMHPSSEKVQNNLNRAKFVDTAVELMLSRMAKKGAQRSRIEAKIFGGARMFQTISASPGVMQIGEENVKATKRELAARNIPIVAESTGGEKGRTVFFDVTSGKVTVKDAQGKQERF
jgi:chemotaxis protein CheD